MRFSIVFLGLLALAAAIPAVPKQQAADQDYLKKQQDVIYLLENIAGELPYAPYYEIGYKYEFDYQSYENPSVVKYYYGLFMSGNVQPKGTPYSYSVSQLRKEVALLTQIFLGAKDYQTFLYAAAWARVHVNQDQFVTAFSNAVLQRSDMAGVILPAPYEVYPQYFFDTRIIQKVQDYVSKYGLDYYKGMGDKQGYYHVYVNYTSYLPYEENQISYFTEDIGLSAYYSYVQLASYMMPYSQYAEKYGAGINHGSDEVAYKKIGHGAYYYYIHQQLMARYNLERLSQGLGPIKELDYYYEHLETPYKPNFRYLNGVNFPGRDEHTYVTPRHHYYELVKVVRALEKRILDAIHTGYIITPAGSFLSLYQPQGYNILGELIEGTGRSVNPRYYGSFQYVARQLLGNAPYFKDIYDYTPSALELGQTAVRDPMFYQLYSKILEFFHYYQEALPAYQYNDVVVPGVYIEKVEMSPLITYFSDYEVSLDNAYAQPAGQEYEKQPYPKIKAHMKRLDHKEYEYTMYVQSKKVVPGAVVRVYVGPKYNYDGQPIDYSEHRHYFYEIDQFVYDLIEGQNVIVRNSHQATGQSYDYPSIYQLKERIQQGFHSQNPYYINYPEQLYGFPARLSLPKGSKSGFPLQFFFIITAGLQHQQEYYGPVLEQEWQTYQPQHYQIVGEEEYSQFASHPVDKVSEYRYYEVIPEYEGQVVVEGNFHYGYLYKKYPGSYYYPYYNKYGHYYPYHNKYSYNYPEGSYYPSYSNEKYASQYAGMYGPEYYQKYAGKYGPEYYEKYGKHYEGKYGPEYYEKYGKHYEGKYGPEYYEKYGKQYEGQYAPEYYEKYGKQYEGKYAPEYYEKYGKQYEGKYGPEYYEKYGKQYEGKYGPEYYEKYGKQYEGKFGPEYYEKYGKQYNMKYSEQYKQEYPGYKSFMPSYMYAKAGDNGKYETVYKQGSYEGYYGSGSYPGSHSFYGTYPYGTYKGYEGHDEYLHNYYRNKHIGDVIGGAVSLDNKPLGYPFDRPLAYSAFYAKNIFVKDVYIYHHDDYYNSEYHY